MTNSRGRKAEGGKQKAVGRGSRHPLVSNEKGQQLKLLPFFLTQLSINVWQSAYCPLPSSVSPAPGQSQEEKEEVDEVEV